MQLHLQLVGKLHLCSNPRLKRKVQLWGSWCPLRRKLQLEGKLQPRRKLQPGDELLGQPQQKLLEGEPHTHSQPHPKKKRWLEGKLRPRRKAQPRRKRQLDKRMRLQGRPRPKVQRESKLGLKTQWHLALKLRLELRRNGKLLRRVQWEQKPELRSPKGVEPAWWERSLCHRSAPRRSQRWRRRME